MGLDGLVTSCNVSKDGKHIVCSVDVDNVICIIDCATASKVMYIKGRVNLLIIIGVTSLIHITSHVQH